VIPLETFPLVEWHKGELGDVPSFTVLKTQICVTRPQCVKDAGLIRSKVQCNSCGRDMAWYADPSVIDRFRWRCRRMVAGTRCNGSRSIGHGSWFQQSKLTIQEVL